MGRKFFEHIPSHPVPSHSSHGTNILHKNSFFLLRPIYNKLRQRHLFLVYSNDTSERFFCDSIGVLKHYKYEHRIVLDPNEAHNILFTPFMKHVQLYRWVVMKTFFFALCLVISRCQAENVRRKTAKFIGFYIFRKQYSDQKIFESLSLNSSHLLAFLSSYQTEINEKNRHSFRLLLAFFPRIE